MGLTAATANSCVLAWRPDPKTPTRLASGRARKSVATPVAPLSLAPQVTAALLEIDSEVPLLELQTVDDSMAEARARDKFVSILFGAFAFIAVGLASIGVYGVAAQVVRFRMKEIGIRLAMGATGNQVAGFLIRRGLTYTLGGVGVGIVGAAFATRLMTSLLYQVAPIDPVIFSGVTFLLISVGLLAAYLPARRAGAMDPSRVLNTD